LGIFRYIELSRIGRPGHGFLFIIIAVHKKLCGYIAE